jgi:hypothetical protein
VVAVVVMQMVMHVQALEALEVVEMEETVLPDQQEQLTLVVAVEVQEVDHKLEEMVDQVLLF